MLKRLLLCAALALSMPMVALAVQPDEVLDDPALESRARELAKVLRCPVCQGENIDESNAEVSRDLRLLVRERLLAGDTDTQVLDYVTDRYGEYVLFEPEKTGANLILYWLGPVALLVALAGGVVYLRGRRRAAEPAGPALSAEEEARLKELLKD
ncbi:cytochrome c-type biogenesis protein [Pseudothioclava nitratireducens]|jgi:cytochrome c-type biogenesis protein CcmH|uniref:cytochrome c-type biogenesis protein n=1 Tax=Pseudothioclava nitratireducens TaxID=1928646 RepID=UPI0023DC5676|nr:cytochrome c-type biogenesis protein [Defluviimonas nitratireducens]MDF1620903.1 cytochrome c-type biogenesis protein CcmH [Defluviimonas nitratireducens]